MFNTNMDEMARDMIVDLILQPPVPLVELGSALAHMAPESVKTAFSSVVDTVKWLLTEDAADPSLDMEVMRTLQHNCQLLPTSPATIVTATPCSLPTHSTATSSSSTTSISSSTHTESEEEEEEEEDDGYSEAFSALPAAAVMFSSYSYSSSSSASSSTSASPSRLSAMATPTSCLAGSSEPGSPSASSRRRSGFRVSWSPVCESITVEGQIEKMPMRPGMEACGPRVVESSFFNLSLFPLISS